MRKVFSLDDSAEPLSALDTAAADGQTLNAAAESASWAALASTMPDVYIPEPASVYVPSGHDFAEGINRTGSANWTSVAASGSQDIDGIMSGAKWTSTTITFSFPTSTAVYGNSYAMADRLPGFSPLNAAQQDAVRYALSLIASYTGLTFVETTAADATLRYGQTSLASLVTADATGPGSATNSGDVWLGTSSGQPFYLTPQIGNWGMATIMRTTGLALGLKPGHEGTPTLPANHDGWDWSVMTARSDPSNAALSFEGRGDNQPHTYMQNDIAALQYLYGANFTYNSSNTTYGFTPTGEMFVNGVSQGVPTDNTLRTIWDGGGVDTYDFSNYVSGVNIRLAPGEFSLIHSSLTVQYRTSTDPSATASGNFANALLFNNDPRSLIENVIGSFGDDSIVGNEGDNILRGGEGWDTLSGGSGNDTLYGDDSGSFYFGSDDLRGDDGNDRLIGGSADTVMRGGRGNDTYWIFSADFVAFENAGEGIDEIGVFDRNFTELPDNIEILRMSGLSYDGYGNASDNVFYGSNRNNHLYGLGGNDAFFGLEGADTLEGGTGNDTYTIYADGDVIVEDINAGTDLVTTTTSFDYTLSANLENLTMGGSGTGTGNESANVLTGSASANYLIGLGGNDKLDGGTGGNDTLAGGQGNDSYYINHLSVVVSEAAGAGTDVIFATVTVSLSVTPEVEGLSLLSGDINGTGNSLANFIQGSTGNNALDGGSGNDTLTGGAGNDTYYVDSASDLIGEASGEGSDLVGATVSYTLSNSVESLYLSGAAVTGTGNGSDNLLFGNNLNNALNGAGGHDLLDGGLGSDTLTGGTGNDVYYVDQAGDSVVEVSGGGTDLVYSSVTYTLSGFVENLVLTASGNGTGNDVSNLIMGSATANVLSGLAGNDTLSSDAGNDTLSGGDGNDSLNGGAGLDVMSGGAGNDTYYVDSAGDVVNEASNAGVDEVFTSVTLTLAGNVENATLLIGGQALLGNSQSNRLTGSSGNDVVDGQDGNDTVSGMEGNDTQFGGNGSDSLGGGDGNDFLDGGVGIDDMAGGLGNDTYRVDHSFDGVIEASNAGLDEVFASVTVYLSAGVENLTLLAGNLSGYGNDLANRLMGSAGDDVFDGQDGNDTAYGLGGYDTLTGGNGDDALDGGEGNDVLSGGTGTNQVYGGLGDDTVYAGDPVSGVAAGVLDGGDGNDWLDLSANVAAITLNLATGANGFAATTVAGFENLNSGAGNDFLGGTDGNNTLAGNGGADTVLGGLGHDSVTGGDGNDWLDGGDGDNTILGGAGNDTLVGTVNGFNVLLDGGDGNDLVDISPFTGDYFVNMVTGATNFGGESLINIESLVSGVGNDHITGNAAANQISVNAGNDTVLAGAGADFVTGGDGIDQLFGEGDDDALYGHDGSDDLYGGAGHDTIYGGSGDDTVTVNDGDDGYDTVDGEDGIDMLDAGGLTYGLTLNMADGSTNVAAIYAGFEVVITGSGSDAITGTAGADQIALNAGNDTVHAGDGADLVTGGDGIDLLFGEGADDTLLGEGGDDDLSGGAGHDTVSGGDGNDTITVADGDDGLDWADGEGGVDMLDASALTFDLALNLGDGSTNVAATFAGFEGVITGSGHDVIGGTTAAEYIETGSGNDWLDGGEGADTLIGGSDNDVYVYTPGDLLIEQAGGGNDGVYSAYNLILASHIENVVLTGSDAISATGNTLNNSLTGNSGYNVLDGGGGADTLIGGGGDDSYYVDASGDNVVEANGAGTDSLFSSVTYSLSGRYVEFLTLTGAANINATGNSLGQTLTGNTGNNSLSGLAGNDRLDGGTGGADTLIGGTGDDTYVITSAGDTITEAVGEGTDLVESAITYTLGNDVERLTLTGAANISGTGNALNNVLTGNAGNNTLAGGAGDDTYYVQNAGDQVSEASNAGFDTVISSVTYSLVGKQADNITLTGSANLNATGNGLLNVLIGNSGANVLDAGSGHDSLDGGAGADTLIGGTGNDSYSVDDAGDTLTELAGGGADLVNASITWTLATDFENLTLASTAAINGTGNAGANVLTGNLGNNILTGLGGNDTYYVQNTGDNVVEAGNGGTDTIFSSVTYNLTGRYIETLTLTGTANINATGNSLDQALNGNGGNNTLNGKGGADVLSGGLGADIFLFETGSGADTITDFSAAQNDSINVNAYTAGVANNGLVTQSGGNVLITLAGGNVITVTGAVVADVLAHMVW